MSYSSDSSRSSGGFIWGLLFGLGIGFLAALLCTPRSGKENQERLKLLLSDAKSDWSENMSASKGQYQSFMKRTKVDLEDKLDQFMDWKQARKIAKAKRRESNEVHPTETFFE